MKTDNHIGNICRHNFRVKVYNNKPVIMTLYGKSLINLVKKTENERGTRCGISKLGKHKHSRLVLYC